MGRLTTKGVSVRLRKSKEGKIEGISYGLEGVAFQGRQLGRDYAWTSLESVFSPESECQASVAQIEKADNRSTPTENPEKLTFLTLQDADSPIHGLESNEAENPKGRLRDKYISLATQVRQFSQFQNRPAQDIDLGVTLLALKAGETLEEAQMILTQSDTVKQWQQELPREIYLKMAKPYIEQVTRQAVELVEQSRRREREKTNEWER